MGTLTDDMKRVVREQRLGFIATVCADGTPNLSPKGTTEVLDDEHLVFADLRSPQTVRNLRTNPSIEINVVDQFVRKGYRFKGTAEVVSEGERFDEIVRSYGNNREIEPERVRAVVIVHVKEAEALVSPAYDMGSSEEQLRQEYMRHFVELNQRKQA